MRGSAGVLARIRFGRSRRARGALWDPVTGLGNADKLRADLEVWAGGRPARENVVVSLYDLLGFKAYNDAYGYDAGDALLRRLAAKLSDAVLGRGRVYRARGDEFGVVWRLGADAGVLAAEAVADALQEVGEGFEVESHVASVALPEEAQDADSALELADRRLESLRRTQRAAAPLEPPAPRALIVPASTYDAAAMAAGVGRRLGLLDQELEDVGSAARLRDVGNMALPDSLLQTPGPLSEEEWRFVRLHTMIGERLLQSAVEMPEVGRIVRSSHERWDGGGYPDGLAGEAIPLGSRIVFVVSAFQDMTSSRSHRLALSEGQALIELSRCSGIHFDPAVVAAFREALLAGAIGASQRGGGPPIATYAHALS